jgi:pimeloyl-ACP methyl ester carboxylesterase
MPEMDEYLERPNGRIAYSSIGPADAAHTLLVVHSLATSRRWEDEAGVFDWSAVADAGQRLVRMDSRGHGGSTGDADAERYRWPALAEDLIAVADTVFPDRPVDALGESTGCGVLLHTALLAPHRFRRLLLVAPPTMGETRAQQAELYTAAARMIELRGSEAWERLIAASAQPPILHDGGWTRPAWVAVREDLIPAVLLGAAASRFPDDEALATIEQRTLILAWDTDLNHPLSTAEHLAERLPDSTLEVAATAEGIRGWGARAAAFVAEG